MKIGSLARLTRAEVGGAAEIDRLKRDLVLDQKGGEDYGFGPGQRVRCYREVAGWFDVPRQWAARRFGSLELEEETTEGEVANFGFTAKLRDYQEPLVTEFLDALDQPKNRYGGILSAPCGCHAKGELILMVDGTRKRAEDVVVGDLLMGIDGPRRVLELHRGRQRMARVTPKKGDSFVVNVGHTLTVLWSVSDGARKDGDVIDISVAEWLLASKNFQRHTVLYRPRVDTFVTDYTDRSRPIEAYHMGMLLGDGTLSKSVGVSTTDPEMVEEVERLASGFGLQIRKDAHGGRCPTYRINSGTKFTGKNSLVAALDSLGLLGAKAKSKFIPSSYLTAPRGERLELLAGLIDSDGSLHYGGFDFVSKSSRLAEGVIFLCRSLGLAAYMKACQKRDQNGRGGTYYRVGISGDCSVVPVRVPRKRAPARKINKDAQRVGFKVDLLPEADYYGFTVDGDNRYLMGDFTWTHNSGKTVMAAWLLSQLGRKAVVLVHAGFLLKQWRETFLDLTDLTEDDLGIVQQAKCEWEDKKIVMVMVESLVGEREYPKEMFESFGVVVMDECVSGDAVIETDLGPVPIADFPCARPSQVLSFNETDGRWEYRNLVRWIPRGYRKTLVICAGGTELRCTEEHPIFTERGWVKAGELLVGDRIASSVPAAAVLSLTDLMGEGAQGGLSMGTEPALGLADRSGWIANSDARDLSQRHLSVPVVAESECASVPILSGSGCGLPSGRSSFLGTIVLGHSGALSEKKLLASSTAHCLGTPASTEHTVGLIPASSSTTAAPNGNGRNIKRPVFLALASELEFLGAKATESRHALVPGCVIPGLRMLFKLSDLQSESPLTGSPEFPKRGGRGGTWMTDRSVERPSPFTRKDFQGEKLGSSPISLGEWDFPASFNARRGATTPFASDVGRPLLGLSDSDDSPPLEWGTSFLTITEIIDDPGRGAEAVYDLEVEGNHNFVANGILVHNCHRHGAVEWSKAAAMFPARTRIGLSATPRRGDGLWDVITWHVGDVLVKEEGGGEATVFQVETGLGLPKDVYEGRGRAKINLARLINAIARIGSRNDLIVDELIRAVKAGRRPLVLSGRLEHLDTLAAQFELRWDGDHPNSDETRTAKAVMGDEDDEFLVGRYVGGMKDKDIERSQKCRVVFGTYQYAKEGLDDPSLDTLFFATPMSDIEQAAGRILRSHPDKKDPLIVDFVDDKTGPCIGFSRRRESQYKRLGFKVHRTTPTGNSSA